MKKVSILLLITFSVLTYGFSQTSDKKEHKDLVKWLTLTEALKKQKESPKKIFIDIYTDWCGWCKVMSKNTFSNPNIASYINQYFYPVRFDAETTDTIEYLGKTYINKGIGRRPTHELAYVLTNNKPSYPTITYLNSRGAIIQALPGYMDTKTIEPYLVYFNENAYRSAPFETFQTAFKRTFEDTIHQSKIQWVSFEDAEKLAKLDPKPIIVDLHTSWSVTSKVMEAVTFTDDSLTNYINEHFYAVHFNPTTEDTIVFAGKTFTNKKDPQRPFHDLAIILTKGKIGIPATIYLDSQLYLLTNVPGYRSPKELRPILKFFGENIYKTKNWNEFMKDYKKTEISTPK